MVTTMVLGMLAGSHSLRHHYVSGQEVWEEPPYVQKMKMGKDAYIPKLRFDRESTYTFQTPDFFQQGKYSVQDGHYEFRAIMANSLENADIAKLKADMDPGSAKKLGDAYARSMSNFTGDYDSSSGILTVYYQYKGLMTPFALHMYTEGDDQLTPSAGDPGLVGLWHTPEPYPDRLDARTRYKIGGIEGLQAYANESTGSAGAYFGLLDLKVDGNYRYTEKVDRWARDGQVVTLWMDAKKIQFTLSADGQKLMRGKLAMFMRG